MDGIFGFDFPFNNLVDTTANPVSLKTNTVSIVMNKIINHIKIKAAHTDAAEIPNIKVKLKKPLLATASSVPSQQLQKLYHQR